MSGKHYEEIPITTLASGYGVAQPVHRITGAQPGPTLGLTAMIHGEEIVPHAVLKQVYDEIDPARLKGTVLMIPVVSPFSYEAQSRHTPLDGLNLNRVFPGSADGMFTEQLAHALVTQFVPQIDYLVDFHGGGLFPTVDYVYLSKVETDFSFAFGSHLLYDGPGYVGTLSGETEARDIASIVVEIGGGLTLDSEYLRRGVEGTFNVMRHLGMVAGEQIRYEDQVVVKEMTVIRPKFGGALYPEIELEKLGTIVPGGTVLGRVINAFTFEEMEVLKAPFERNYMILIRGPITRVNPGDFAYMCANADIA